MPRGPAGTQGPRTFPVRGKARNQSTAPAARLARLSLSFGFLEPHYERIDGHTDPAGVDSRGQRLRIRPTYRLAPRYSLGRTPWPSGLLSIVAIPARTHRGAYGCPGLHPGGPSSRSLRTGF